MSCVCVTAAFNKTKTARNSDRKLSCVHKVHFQIYNTYKSLYFKNIRSMSIGKGKMIVEFFSADIELRVCR